MNHLTYTQPSRSGDRYDLGPRGRNFAEDPAMRGAFGDRASLVPLLASSESWQDRVRAAAVIESLRGEVVLPDDFPVIVEAEDSPSLLRSSRDEYRPEQHVWVAHPRMNILELLLPEYQEMWDGYTSRWGPSARRVFQIARVSNVPVGHVRRENATVDDVLIATASLVGMRLPERLAHTQMTRGG